MNAQTAQKIDRIIELLERIDRSLNNDPLPLADPIFKPVLEQNFLIVLDAGHGGLDKEGVYTTAPSKMRQHRDFTFYEGVYNRMILERLVGLLKASGYRYEVVSHKWKDNSLRGRVSAVKKLNAKEPCLFFSIHGNAAHEKATGIEVFTSIGKTKSDLIADQQIKNLRALLPDVKYRLDTTDGDLDKEADFYVLKRTPCPAILTEYGFFTNYEEAKRMLTDDWIFNCALATFNTISWANLNLK